MRAGGGVSEMLLQYAIAEFGVNEVDVFVISRRSMVVRLACGARRRAEYHYIAALKLYSTGISP